MLPGLTKHVGDSTQALPAYQVRKLLILPVMAASVNVRSMPGQPKVWNSALGNHAKNDADGVTIMYVLIRTDTFFNRQEICS